MAGAEHGDSAWMSNVQQMECIFIIAIVQLKIFHDFLSIAMKNNLQRALYWKKFILSRCDFPAPRALQAQFDAAELVEFCECGCNSFRVRTRSDANPPPIARPGGYGAVFEADFRMAHEDKSVEIILFAGDTGNLEYVEIDCCSNTYPVPEMVELMEAPYHINISASLIK